MKKSLRFCVLLALAAALLTVSAFADTAGYLYDNVSRYVKDKYGLNTAMVSGSVEGRTTCP